MFSTSNSRPEKLEWKANSSRWRRVSATRRQQQNRECETGQKQYTQALKAASRRNHNTDFRRSHTSAATHKWLCWVQTHEIRYAVAAPLGNHGHKSQPCRNTTTTHSIHRHVPSRVRFLVPLNAMCSRKCATPLVDASSKREPASIQRPTGKTEKKLHVLSLRHKAT